MYTLYPINCKKIPFSHQNPYHECIASPLGERQISSSVRHPYRTVIAYVDLAYFDHYDDYEAEQYNEDT